MGQDKMASNGHTLANLSRFIMNSSIIRLKYRSIRSLDYLLIRSCSTTPMVNPQNAEGPSKIDEKSEEQFRVLIIPGYTHAEEKKEEKRISNKKPVAPPRYKSMPVDQDWTNVWPSANTFKWSAVPFPVRQGYVQGLENAGVPPGRYANAELMKIPNFLHLTP